MVDPPRTVAGVIRRGFAIWANSATALWGVLLPLSVLSQLVSVLLIVVAAPSGSTVINGTIYVPAGSSTGAIATAHIVALALTALIAVLAAGVSLRVLTATATGSRSGGREALRFAWARYGGLLWLGILYLAVVAGGSLLLVLPGIYVAVACTAALPVLVLEDKRGFDALRRARDLSKGRWWATLGAIAPAWVVVVGGGLLVNSVLRSSGSVAGSALTEAFGGLVIQVLLVPIGTAAAVAVYFELRARHEPLPAVALPASVVAPPPAGADIWWS